jgi:hypothetical protein
MWLNIIVAVVLAVLFILIGCSALKHLNDKRYTCKDE